MLADRNLIRVLPINNVPALKLKKSSVVKFSRCPLFLEKNFPKNGHWRYSFQFSLFYIALSLCSPLRSCKKLDFKYYRRQLVSRCAAERKEASRGLYIGYGGSRARMKMKQ
jgi:hypothetical protein